MLKLEQALHAWGTPGFDAVLKCELAQQAGALPLQQALASGSRVAEAPLEVVVYSHAATPARIRVRVGVFYRSVIDGCSCADDPTPPSEYTEHCDLLLEIDCTDGVTAVTWAAG